LHFEVLNFAHLAGHICDLISQHFDVGWIISSRVQCSGWESPSTHLLDSSNGLGHFALQSSDRFAQALEVCMLACNLLVVIRYLLLKAKDSNTKVGLGCWVESLAVLMLWCAH
jgi:hypothetical protein